MNYKSVFLTALVAGLLPVAAVAQASPEPPAAPPAAPAAQPAAPAAQPALPVPEAFPAKIALIAFQQAVIATNEGQRALADIRKKYEPKQTQLEGVSNEIDTLKKQLQSAPATLSDTERAARMKTLDTKQKQLDRDTEDARTAYQADLQDAYGKIAQKVNAAMISYVEKNGYTVVFDVGGEQSSIMWAKREPSGDITEAVVNAYNASSGIAPPPPDAPAGPAAHPTKPAGTAPHTTTPPKPATTPTKPPTK